ncbi:hypothetical protein MBLNU230_g5366t1 [Neophaeotheca triangularis]
MTPTIRPTGPFADSQHQGQPHHHHQHEGARGLHPPPRPSKDRTPSSNSVATIKQMQHGHSYARSAGPQPGSFAADFKPAVARPDMSRADLSHYPFHEESGDVTSSEHRQAQYRQKIDKEMKIKLGSENMLEALNAKNHKQTREQRKMVESELNTSNKKIAQWKLDLEEEITRSKEQPASPMPRLSQLFQSAPIRSPTAEESLFGDAEHKHKDDTEGESASYVLAEILQALEAEDLHSDYYVNHANELVELFKRHPTLKYDLAWSIFGLRMQMMLLSSSREVVAAGYRVMRYAITDRKSLQTIRTLNTDYIVILSLVKESKARVEREQALKFIRAFLDVKDGALEIHPAIARIVVAVAEHHEDQLRSIAILTVAEMLLKHPHLVVDAGGIGVLSEAMGNGAYPAPDALIHPLLYLMDLPARRGMLKSGFEFSSAFASFTEPHFSHTFEDRLKASSKVIAAMFKSWSGLMTLSLHDFLPVRSVIGSLYIGSVPVRPAVLDLLIDILRIKPPAWSSSFIGGRRLTTYGRVTNLKAEPTAAPASKQEDDHGERKRSLVDHFTAVVLVVLLRQGLLKGLMHAESNSPSEELTRKTHLIIAEVLKMASELLPSSWNGELQTLPGLVEAAIKFKDETRFQATHTVYQVDSVNRTLYRLLPGQSVGGKNDDPAVAARARASSKSHITAGVDEATFRALMIETQVLSTVNYTKWKWDIIQQIIEGPLLNPRRLHEAMVATKFVHRILGFLRPFKYRFSDAPNTKANQRYVRAGCALAKTLLQTPEGAKHLAESKTIRQLAENMAQMDSESGLTAADPLFSAVRLSETLVGGYFQILGAMCQDQRGLSILERWKFVNMFYHIVERRNRDDLIRTLLTSLDYSLDSHPRIILAKAMVASSKPMRIAATRILRKYANLPISATDGNNGSGPAQWAIRLLVGQLYDPEIEVCEVAIKILEEACNDIDSLEYVVKCRPALDHLGEIGAPLLLRFLSTSVGYHYLDGLDYITREMDDWFLGRNDSYVTLVEASLARALSDTPHPSSPHTAFDDTHPEVPTDLGAVPPHFYRELTRTHEGCALLASKQHFTEFAATISDFAHEQSDAETILKVKGCLWAVGNVGSMELGAPFLEESDVVKDIVSIAENSEVMTLRGTAFFVLGLISRSLHGQELLAEYGWDGTTSEAGEGLGYCLPLDFTQLFSLGPSSTAATAPGIRARRPSLPADPDPTTRELLASVTKLGNTVLTNKALAELSALKHRADVKGFGSVEVFGKVMVVLASHGYRIPQWRFVCDLFETDVLRRLVLEEGDPEDDEGEEGEESASESASGSESD